MEIIFACSIGSIKLEKASVESLYCSLFTGLGSGSWLGSEKTSCLYTTTLLGYKILYYRLLMGFEDCLHISQVLEQSLQVLSLVNI